MDRDFMIGMTGGRFARERSTADQHVRLAMRYGRRVGNRGGSPFQHAVTSLQIED